MNTTKENREMLDLYIRLDNITREAFRIGLSVGIDKNDVTAMHKAINDYLIANGREPITVEVLK